MTGRPALPAPRVRGGLRISDRALSRVVAQAAKDGTLPATGTPRARVRRRGAEAEADVRLVLRYPGPLAEGAAAAAESAERQSRAQAGLRLRRTRVLVAALDVTDAPAPAQAGRPPAPAKAARAARRWTARRVPAALLSAVGLAAAVLWWLARVRGVAHPHGLDRAFDALATARAGDLPVLAAAAVGGLLGLWLVALAVTAGRPAGWRISPPAGAPPVEVDRRLVQREIHRALDLPARVRVHRRGSVRITVRSALPPDAVRQATRDAYTRLGFDGAPRTVVRVRRTTDPEPVPSASQNPEER
ncbi:hypothetical protein ACIRBX_36450 [Kitasatospora sp. NPDC096147]|uniref:hypothetical protein n=1 Tax=Kitasatospora sp. NPDC096147 TaxID=3364093 RepID=UPI00380DC480